MTILKNCATQHGDPVFRQASSNRIENCSVCFPSEGKVVGTVIKLTHVTLEHSGKQKA